MRNFIQPFKDRFDRLNYREKFLLLAFTGLLTLFWMSGCFQQAVSLTQNWKLVNAKIKNHRFWIKNEGIIKNNLDKVLEVMDPQKTLSGAAFAGEIENVVRSYDMTYSMSSPRTRQGDIFDAHTLQLHCENVSIQNLIAFEKDIYAKKPYLTLEKVKLHANLFNPELLEADCFLSALQLKDVVHEK